MDSVVKNDGFCIEHCDCANIKEGGLAEADDESVSDVLAAISHSVYRSVVQKRPKNAPKRPKTGLTIMA